MAVDVNADLPDLSGDLPLPVGAVERFDQLGPVRGGNGSMTFADGTHRTGDLGGGLISDASEGACERAVAERGISCTTYATSPRVRPPSAPAGRCTAPRRTPPTRCGEVTTVISFADGARLLDPVPPNQELDARAWLPGCAPGALAASEKSPVVG